MSTGGMVSTVLVWHVVPHHFFNNVVLFCSVLQIVISWVLSPLAAGIVCLVIFLIVRTVVLRRKNSTTMAFYVLPVLLIITIWVVRHAQKLCLSASRTELCQVGMCFSALLCVLV